MGLDRNNVKVISCGDVLEVSENTFDVTGHVQARGVFVDGLGVGDVGNIVLRDRQHLSENGLIVVTITLDKLTGEILAGPDIVSRGFVYVREAESLIEEIRDIVDEVVCYETGRGITDWNKLKSSIREALGEFLWQKTKRSPMILPVISEVEL